MKKLIIILFQICLISYISQAQIINIEDKRVRLGDSIAFKGHFDVGFNIVKNDKKLITVAGITQCEYVNHRHVVLGLSGYNWEVIFRQAVYKTDFDFFLKKKSKSVS